MSKVLAWVWKWMWHVQPLNMRVSEKWLQQNIRNEGKNLW